MTGEQAAQRHGRRCRRRPRCRAPARGLPRSTSRTAPSSWPRACHYALTSASGTVTVRGHGYRAGVPNSYTTLWTNALCQELERSGYTGQRLTMLFGGPHQSLPSFQRAGVQPGDRISPVRARRTRLHVLGALEVAHIVPYENVGSALPDDDYVKLLDWRPLKTGCVTEVLVGPPGAPLRF